MLKVLTPTCANTFSVSLPGAPVHVVNDDQNASGFIPIGDVVTVWFTNPTLPIASPCPWPLYCGDCDRATAVNGACYTCHPVR